MLRWELARLEVRAAAGPVKWLLITLPVVAVMALSAVPILAVGVADLLGGIGDAGWLGLSRTRWLLIFGCGLLIGGTVGGYLAWRRFRRRFVGLEQTLEELREDAVWLRAWAGRGEDESEV